MRILVSVECSRFDIFFDEFCTVLKVRFEFTFRELCPVIRGYS